MNTTHKPVALILISLVIKLVQAEANPAIESAPSFPVLLSGRGELETIQLSITRSKVLLMFPGRLKKPFKEC